MLLSWEKKLPNIFNMKFKKTLLIFIIILGGFLRFYKLDWGEGLFAHPDEYHIVTSVNQLVFPTQMHPHFFNYGTVVIYLIYFTKLFSAAINPFLIGRFYSALFSTLTIFVIYKIAKFALEEKYAILSTFLVAITPGLIQQAHFATPESALTFFVFTSLFFLIQFLKKTNLSYLLISSIFLGLGLGTKITAGFFFPVIFLALSLKLLRSPFKLISFLLASLLTSLATFIITSPFVFLDYANWQNSFNHENAVAQGSSLVFYTRQFIETYPLVFQLEKILPYALGIFLLVFGVLGIAVIFLRLVKKFELSLFIILVTFLCLFIPNLLLFAKWTRFIAPTFPFIGIFAAFFLQILNRKFRLATPISTGILLIPTVLWSLAFFSIYLNHDVRITADNWMKTQLPMEAIYLIEGGNTVDLPLSSPNKISLDFYDFEDNPKIRESLIQSLEKSDYFIIQSRRVFLNHQRLSNLYPKTAHFYNTLFNGQLGFQEIKEFHSYPSLSFIGIPIEFPDENAEETWTVFDHPVIRIFKKEK